MPRSSRGARSSTICRPARRMYGLRRMTPVAARILPLLAALVTVPATPPAAYALLLLSTPSLAPIRSRTASVRPKVTASPNPAAKLAASCNVHGLPVNFFGTQPEGITSRTRPPRRDPVRVHPPRQADRVRLRELAGCRVVVAV